MGHLRESVEQIKERIAEAAFAAGRDPKEIELMAVTKTLGYDSVIDALSEGITLFGENRVQEATGKYPPPPRECKLHLVGHLQRNKAKHAIGFFDCVESVDKTETADALNRRCMIGDQSIDILLEYNTSGEDTKSGYTSIDSLKRSLSDILQMKQIRIRGVMTIGPFTNDESKIRNAFAEAKKIFDGIEAQIGSDDFDTLSMGMSSDFELAIAEGSTRIRVGTALFGARS